MRVEALRDLRNMDLFENCGEVAIVQETLESRQQHMNIMKRCHFQLTGKTKFDALALKLMEYVDCLLKMSSEAAAEV